VDRYLEIHAVDLQLRVVFVMQTLGVSSGTSFRLCLYANGHERITGFSQAAACRDTAHRSITHALCCGTTFSAVIAKVNDDRNHKKSTKHR
jgi:hypothetical protein